MKSSMVPGHTWLFPGEPLSYDEYLKELPSEMVIAIAIMMNNELETQLGYEAQQERIFKALTYRFTPQQKQYVQEAFLLFKQRTNGLFSEDIFRREYFMKIILKETRRNAVFELTDLSPQQEVNFFMAYMLLIDEINRADFSMLEELRKYETDPLGIYISSWTANLSKFQFNERVSPLFEIFKLGCLAKYALHNWRIHLKEYLNFFGLNTIGNLMHFFNTGIQAALRFEKDKVITNLSYIVPNINVSVNPFSGQSINAMIGTEKEVKLSDFKLFPLFHNKERGYMVMDKNFYFKKIYRGPLFELCKNTGLRSMGFNKYSGEVSKKVVEESCFQAIAKVLAGDERDVLYFDNSSNDGFPDCYIRKGNIVLLFECKANILAELHLDEIQPQKAIERFNAFKDYLDDRFIATKNGSPKGITQLKNQIALLTEEGKCSFDSAFPKLIAEEQVIIYPMICHDDFNFSMPGINEYLNDRFIELLKPFKEINLVVKDMTVIRMENLFDLVLRQGSFNTLKGFLDCYWQIISERKMQWLANTKYNDPLPSRRSFDELYSTNFIHELPNVGSIPKPLDSLLNTAGITQDILNETV